MNRWIKWTAGGVATVVVLAAVTAVVGLQLGERKMARKVGVSAMPVA
jgi:hypothetical protein